MCGVVLLRVWQVESWTVGVDMAQRQLLNGVQAAELAFLARHHSWQPLTPGKRWNVQWVPDKGPVSVRSGKRSDKRGLVASRGAARERSLWAPPAFARGRNCR